MTIDCAFIGRLGQDPELNTSVTGSPAPGSRLTRLAFPYRRKATLSPCRLQIIECEDWNRAR